MDAMIELSLELGRIGVGVERLKARIYRLESVCSRAPHGSFCKILTGEGECSCWKRELAEAVNADR